MVTVPFKNYNFKLPTYKKFFSFMGGAAIITEFPQFWTC